MHAISYIKIFTIKGEKENLISRESEGLEVVVPKVMCRELFIVDLNEMILKYNRLEDTNIETN